MEIHTDDPEKPKAELVYNSVASQVGYTQRIQSQHTKEIPTCCNYQCTIHEKHMIESNFCPCIEKICCVGTMEYQI